MEASDENQLRPHTAKFTDLKSLRGGHRPFSANKTGLLRRAKEQRPRAPKQLYSREELYALNMDLKMQINQLQTANLKLSTKVKVLEKDSRKEELSDQKGHLVHKLKTQIKDMLKKQDEKDSEIAELKKTAKNSKLQEHEVEVKVYIDECTRLKRMLQEALLQLSMSVAPHGLQQRHIQQSVQLKTLRKEYNELNQLCEEFKFTGKGKRKKDEWILHLKQALSQAKDLQAGAQGEIQMLRSQIGRSCPNCQNAAQRDLQMLVWDIWQSIEHRKLDVGQMLDILNPERGPLTPQILTEGLEKLGVLLSIGQLQVLLEGKAAASEEEFVEILQQERPKELTTFDMVEETLTHFSYRMQVRRISHEQTPHFYFQEPRMYHIEEVANMMASEPAQLGPQQSKQFAMFVYGSAKSLPAEELIARFFDLLEPWDLISEEAEGELDGRLREIVASHGSKLKDFFRKHDKDGTSEVPLSVMQDAFRKFGVEADEDLYRYLALLFYTDQFQLGKVPYVNFLQAYSTEPQPN